MNNGNPITHTKFGSNTMEQPTQYGSNNTEVDIFFADGLSEVRADLKIYESIIINFFACDDNTIFDLHFTPPLNQQTCGRPKLHCRIHAWRTEITQCILGAPQPLVIYNHINLHYYENFNNIINLYK